MANVANVSVALRANVTRFSRGIGRATRILSKFGAAATAITGGGLGILAARATDVADTQAKAAQKLGITQQELVKWQFAAEKVGISAQQVETGIQRMSRRVSEAAAGFGEARGALGELGLDAGALANLSAGDQLSRVVAALGQVENAGQRLRLAVKIFDTEGAGFVRFLGADLDEAERKVRQFGLALDPSQLKQIENAKDAFADVRAVLSGIALQIGAVLAPIVQDIATAFVNWASSGTTASEKIQGALMKVVDIAGAVVAVFDNIRGAIQLALAPIFAAVGAFARIANTIPGIKALVPDSLTNLRFGPLVDRALKTMESTVEGRQGQFADVVSRYFGAAEQAAEQAARKSDALFLSPAGVAPGTQAPLKTATFQEIDLSRFVLGGAATRAGQEQVVRDPQIRETNKKLDAINNTLQAGVPAIAI